MWISRDVHIYALNHTSSAPHNALTSKGKATCDITVKQFYWQLLYDWYESAFSEWTVIKIKLTALQCTYIRITQPKRNKSSVSRTFRVGEMVNGDHIWRLFISPIRFIRARMKRIGEINRRQIWSPLTISPTRKVLDTELLFLFGWVILMYVHCRAVNFILITVHSLNADSYQSYSNCQ